MQKLLYAFQVYFMQETAVCHFLITLGLIVGVFYGLGSLGLALFKLHTGELKAYFKCYVIHTCIAVGLILILTSILFFNHNLLNTVPIEALFKNSKITEEYRYYFLHFNPEEPIVFDDNGDIFRLNGDEALVEIPEAVISSFNYIKVKRVTAELDDYTFNRLVKNIPQQTFTNHSILLHVEIEETVFNG